MKKLRITVDGRVFDVTVEQADDTAPAAPAPVAAPVSSASTPGPAPLAAAPAPVPAQAHAAAPAGAVCSPLAGKVVSIEVQVGTSVAVGAQLATIEAMKMNTFVYAERAGKVTGITAKPGDAVEEGGPLLILG
ncbi:MAG: glutaconyl-CoA/methylmalonyl-CoA decarboxylase subunit gamma [Verrucomicrobiota bacterium]|nr:glutaconyl-CoA/methylmalonyl-CoA decarboxylase subunit gamma [Verrucomicrobiota bacterium]